MRSSVRIRKCGLLALTTAGLLFLPYCGGFDPTRQIDQLHDEVGTSNEYKPNVTSDPNRPIPTARTRGNTMLEMPNRRYAADLTGDGRIEWIDIIGRKLRISTGEFEEKTLAAKVFPSNITKVVTGRFQFSYKSTMCIMLADGSLRLYELNPYTHDTLWWGFTQYNSGIANNDELIAGDFDADNKDELLVYRPSSGVFRLFEIGSDGFMRPHNSFDIGNLSDAAKLKNKIVIVGNFADFAGEGHRDDLILYDETTTTLSRYDGRKTSSGKTTFWWAFTSLIPVTNDQVSVANIDNGEHDSIILYNKGTGKYRFYSNTMKHFYPETGQLPGNTNMRLFWVKTSTIVEPGYMRRHDALFWDQNRQKWIMYHARHSSSGFTYWWAYTQSHITKKAWTLMVYLNGDSNLSDQVNGDLQEMKAVRNSNQINIVVLADRDKHNDSKIYSITNGKMTVVNTQEFGATFEADMEDEATLSKFVRWAIDHYPADKYFLDIWDHGDGWKFNTDYHKMVSGISVAKGNLSIALQEITNHLERRIDVIGFDACLMANWEVATAVRPFAKYMVGSEDLEPGSGWVYNNWLSAYNMNWDEEAMCSRLVQSYNSSTLSCYELGFVNQLSSLVDNLAEQLNEAVSRGSITYNDINDAIEHTIQYARPYGSRLMDLYHFTERVAADFGGFGQIVKACTDLQTFIDNGGFIVANKAQSNHSHGITIYFGNDDFNYGNQAHTNGYVPPWSSNSWYDFIKNH